MLVAATVGGLQDGAEVVQGDKHRVGEEELVEEGVCREAGRESSDCVMRRGSTQCLHTEHMYYHSYLPQQ